MKVSLCLLISAALARPLENEHGMSDMASPMVGNEDGANSSNSSSSSMDMDMDATPMSMEHHHGRPVLENPHLEPQQRKYWEQYNTTSFFTSAEGNKFNLWTHGILSFVSFGLLAPITILLSTDSRTQWLYIPLQTFQTALAIGSYLFLAFYAVDAPKLFEGNAYSGFTIAMLIFSLVHWFAMIVKSMSEYLSYGSPSYRYFHPGSGEADTDAYPLNDDPEAYAMDDVSETRHASLSSTEYSGGSDTEISSFDNDHNPNTKRVTNNGLGEAESQLPSSSSRGSAPSSKIVQILSQNRIFLTLNSFLGRFASIIFHGLNYPMFALGWGYMLTGLATGFLMGKDWRIFALLAHFIKGFVFFLLGFIELARFFGAGASRGWAWNEVFVRPSKSQSSIHGRILSKFLPEAPSIEFVQSFLIFFYGSTNVFLEHLGNKDGVWSHKDLQHASIAFMFFGGGLCGMTVESNALKRKIGAAFGVEEDVGSNGRIRRTWSVNPMPAFIIFWTGALMSHHQQETELATQIHMQWGYLFSLAAILRLFTMALMLTRPRASSEQDGAQPQRPFTELLVSFCLICGGMIFMASNRETVEGMIYRGIDQMFTVNVSVGVTVLLMSYFTGCLAIKGWACSKYT